MHEDKEKVRKELEQKEKENKERVAALQTTAKGESSASQGAAPPSPPQSLDPPGSACPENIPAPRPCFFSPLVWARQVAFQGEHHKMSNAAKLTSKLMDTAKWILKFLFPIAGFPNSDGAEKGFSPWFMGDRMSGDVQYAPGSMSANLWPNINASSKADIVQMLVSHHALVAINRMLMDLRDGKIFSPEDLRLFSLIDKSVYMNHWVTKAHRTGGSPTGGNTNDFKSIYTSKGWMPAAAQFETQIPGGASERAQSGTIPPMCVRISIDLLR